MSKSKSGTKKKFKLNSIWILLIVVVALVASLVFGNMIATYVRKSGGQRAFDKYMKAAASQNVESIASTLYKKGSPEYGEFVEKFSEGKQAYAEFLKENAPGSSGYNDFFMNRDFDENDAREYGLLLAVEQQIAKNIKSYEFESHKAEPYYDEFSVAPQTKVPFAASEFPAKYRSYIDDSFANSFTVKFSSASGDWLFIAEFSLLKKLGEIKTWYAPYGDGVELKYLNPDDLHEAQVQEGGQTTTIKMFDTTLEVEGKKILSIGSYAFEDCQNIEKVILNNSIVNIGNYAFKNCFSLTDIVYENDSIIDTDRNVKIGEGAFYGCKKLTSFTIPKVNKIIPDYVFYDCLAITNVEINEGTQAIGHYAYAAPGLISLSAIERVNFGLTALSIPSSVTAIGDGAFLSQMNLAGVDGLDNNIIRLGANVFNGCSSLTSIQLPNTITRIQDGTFANCTSLTTIVLPNNLREIGRQAFAQTGLQLLSMPSSVEVVGVGAFESSALSVLEWPANTKIRAIGAQAFKNCENLYEFTLPKTVRQIGAQAFVDCSRLRVIKVFCDGNISLSEDSFQYKNSIPKLYVPDTANYRGANWNHLEIYPQSIISGDFAVTSYEVVKPDGTTATEKMLVQFLGGIDKVDVTLDDEITKIGSGAFAYSQYVRAVRFDSEKITAIGENAFTQSNIDFSGAYAHQKKITNLDKDTLYYIGDWLISAEGENRGSKYTGITLDLATTNNRSGFSGLPSTRGIAAEAVYFVSNLREIYLPASLVYIGENVFKNSPNVTEVTLQFGSVLEEIGAGAFEGCVSFTSIELPQSVNKIGDRAFYDCDSLRFVIINNSVRTMLGEEVFTHKQDVLKIYIDGLSASDSDYKTDEQWQNYKSFSFDMSILVNNLFALSDNGDGTYELIQYLGLPSEDSAANIDLQNGADINVDISAIHAGAFATANIASVIIPHTVKEIGNYAFFKCRTLRDVELKANNANADSLNRIGDFAFSQTNLDDDLARFVIAAAEPKADFSMGANVFDNTVVRAIEVSVRAKYIANNYWKNYSKAFNAKDDPVVNIRIEVDGSLIDNQTIHSNSVGRFNEANIFEHNYGAPFEELTFRANVDVRNGYKFIGWYDYNETTDERGTTLLSTELIYSVELGDSGSEKHVIAVFERYATPVKLEYFAGSTEAMGTFEVLGLNEDGLFEMYDEDGHFKQVTIKATAASGYEFSGWLIDNVPVSNLAEYTFTITEDMTIHAMFVLAS